MKKSVLASFIAGVCNFFCEKEEETQHNEQETIVQLEHYARGDIVQLVPWGLPNWRYNTGEETYVVHQDCGTNVRLHIFNDIFFIAEEDIPRRYLGLVRHEQYPSAYAHKSSGQDGYKIEITAPDMASMYVSFARLSDDCDRKELLRSIVEALRTIPRDLKTLS